MKNNLVLSIFPGIDLLGRAFEEQGYCVVRGPDLLWGGDIKTFHPPAGVFEGIIGGPPCQCFSRLRYLNPLAGQKHGNLIPEYERVVSGARPEWFVMENVTEGPEPVIRGYQVKSYELNNRWLGAEQNRLRRFSFGTPDGLTLDIEVALFESPVNSNVTVLAGHGPVGRGEGYQTNLSLSDACRLQGLPEDFTEDMPFTEHGKRKVIGNGVPLSMGRAIAKAIRKATA